MDKEESFNARMYVCEALLQTNGDAHDSKKYNAYKKANILLKEWPSTNTAKCTVLPDSLHYDPRGPMATMKIECLEALKSAKKEGTWYKVVNTTVK